MPLVIFDIDGTLTHTTGVDDSSFVGSIREALGLDGFDTDWANYPHATDGALLAEMVRRSRGDAVSAAELARVRELFFAKLREHAAVPGRIEEVPGARAMLGAIAHRHGPRGPWQAALATGAWGDSARIKLAAAGIDISVLPFANADDAHSRADITCWAIARALGYDTIAEPEKLIATAARRYGGVVYLGDGVWDVKTSLGLGLGFIGVRVEGDQGRLREHGARHIIHDYSDSDGLLDLIGHEAAQMMARQPAAGRAK